MDAVRIEARIVTFINKTGRAERPHREIFLDFSHGGTVFAKVELYGYHYVVQNGTTTGSQFTFSPTLTPYDSDRFKKFVATVKSRGEASFHIDATGHKSGFSMTGGTLTYESSYYANSITIPMKYYDLLGKDLDEMAKVFDAYMEMMSEKEMVNFVKMLDEMSANL
jgi:hypothetical protein